MLFYEYDEPCNVDETLIKILMQIFESKKYEFNKNFRDLSIQWVPFFGTFNNCPSYIYSLLSPFHSFLITLVRARRSSFDIFMRFSINETILQNSII